MKYLFMLFIVLSIGLISAEITYEVSWDEDEVINGRDFEVIVDVEGEDDTIYDGKLWIESKGKIISDGYDEKKESWRSGYYYINEFFVDGVNKVSLRIDEDYRNFIGGGFIYFKFRDNDQIGNEIEVLKFKEIESDEDENTDNPIEDSKEEPKVENVEGEVKEIVLEPISLGIKVSTVEEKDINTDNVVYQSKGFKILEIAVYGFTLLCVLLCILVIWRKLD